ncbi:hypothetical protein [Streptomyces vinaceus]|uniref:hypothetical protein n=1 Tax=Streptomyces vinaceus TaxID=1960 RepID=UPI0035D9E248
MTEVISSEPIAGRHQPGGYQHVLLDTVNGELRFHESTEHLEPWDPAWKAVNDVPRSTWERWHPGTMFLPGGGPHQWFEPVPGLLSWTLRSGIPEWPYLDVTAANAFLEDLVPSAQELLDGLFQAGGELDWSAASARASRNMDRVCNHLPAAPAQADAQLTDFGQIVDRFPQVYQPELLRLSLEDLAKECEYITRFLGSNKHWHPEIKKVFGAPYADGSGVGLDVLGVRSWYRTVLLDGDPRPVRAVTDWDAEHDSLSSSGITSTSADADLDAWAEREELRAAREGLRLLGAQGAARSHRASLREKDWDRLAVVGAEVARIEEELDQARAARLELVTRAIDWGQADAAIGTRARMTRQAVHKIRTGRTDTGE